MYLIFVVLMVSLIMLIYPYIIYPMILNFLSNEPLTKKTKKPTSASLLFCAFNEERSLPDKINNLYRLKELYPFLEILAYDDDSDDQTRSILKKHSEIITVIEGNGRNGKAYGMKKLAELARGEILIFTDANVTLKLDSIANLQECYQDPNVGGVCGKLEYVTNSKTVTAEVGDFYWKLEERIKNLESNTGNVMGADGSIFSIRKMLYPMFPDTVLDDMTVSMSVIFAGLRLVKDDSVVAYEQLVTERSDERSRKIRIAARAFHTHQYLRPLLGKMSIKDKFKYFSHKYVRWMGGVNLILVYSSLILLSVSINYFFTLAILITTLMFIGLGKGSTGAVGKVYEVLLSILCTQSGVVKAARGQTFITWSPAKSRT